VNALIYSQPDRCKRCTCLADSNSPTGASPQQCIATPVSELPTDSPCYPPTSVPTEPVGCRWNGQIFPVGQVFYLKCEVCYCTRDANNTFSWYCKPITTDVGTDASVNCTTTPPPVTCRVGTTVYNVGDLVIDRARCTQCKCLADGTIGSCTPIAGCGDTKPTCRIGNITLAVGESYQVSRCKICRCVEVPITNDFSTTQTELLCVETSTNCSDPTYCYVDNKPYPLGFSYIDGCKQCYCSTSGWLCRTIVSPPRCPDPTVPSVDFCVFGSAVIKINQTVEVGPCRICTCVYSTSDSGVSAPGLYCRDRPGCTLPTDPTSTATATAAATTKPAPVDPLMCYDASGHGFLPGSVVPARDGCGICRCGWDGLLDQSSTAPSSKPQWICRPITEPTSTFGGFNNFNGTCCVIDGVVYPAGWPKPIIDRDNCKSCMCTKEGKLVCTQLDTDRCGVCTFDGKRYLPGDSRPNPNGCGRCDCSNGQWVCPSDATCKRDCVSVKIEITFSNRVNISNGNIDKARLAALLDATIGVGKWEFVSYESTPSGVSVVIIIRCFDSEQPTATDAGASISGDLSIAFSNAGVEPDNVQSSVVDEGTDSSTSAATANSAFAMLAIVAALLALLA
jgi:hypothetical protein